MQFSNMIITAKLPQCNFQFSIGKQLGMCKKMTLWQLFFTNW